MSSEKPEIKYDEVDIDSAIDDFGDETVQFCIQAFLDKTYNELKTNLPSLYKAQNYKDIRGKMHILKTNSGYMGATNFQGLCKEFETCCKFESLNVERIDELYPIFMTNLDKLQKKLKILYNEKFEQKIKEEVELENKKDEEDKINENKKEEEKIEEIKEENKNEENIENNIIIEEKNDEENNKDKIIKEEINEENKEEKKEENREENREEIKEEKKEEEINEKIEEKKDETNLEENENNNYILKKNPVRRDFSLQQPNIASIKMNIRNLSNQNLNTINNENEKSYVSSEHSLNINDIIKPRTYSCKNVLDLISLKEGTDQKYHQNQFYKNIFQSFRLTEEESKNKKVPKKVRFSPKYTSESRKNKILNQLKLGFFTLDKSDIRDSLKRYDLSVLKNSATLVKENLIKFLNEEIPKLKEDFNYFLKNHDLSKKKEVIEKINIIISNMKYLSDNYNTFFFRMIERLEICKDKKNFKLILEKLIDKLKLLEQELTIIYRVKIKRDNSLLKSLGYFQNDNVNKTSKKSLLNDTHNNYNNYNYNAHRNKENNSEQIEGLKKNLGMYSGKNKSSKKKLIHFPYSFKAPRLFCVDDIKNIRASFKKDDPDNKNSENNIILVENKENEDNEDKNNIENFNKDCPQFLELFKSAINNKSKDELIHAINEFKNNLVKKYCFINMEPSIDRWISKINIAESFGDLNAHIEDLSEIIDYMKMDLENKIIESNNGEESQENDDIFFNEEKQKKMQEENLDKEDMAFFNQLKKFNPDAFFLPINQGMSQHKFKIKVEKMIRETTQNTQEIIPNNYNSNYNLVEKASSHIILSQNFRTKKNKLIGFSYPFKEDTFLSNCNIV